MKPITAYRRATDAGLLIDLSADRRRLLVFGPRKAKEKLMPLLKRHCGEIHGLLIQADNNAGQAIRAAMQSARSAPLRSVRCSPCERRASQGGV